jgi:3-oxoacyl-[acyl-carrier-protein] synthase II
MNAGCEPIAVTGVGVVSPIGIGKQAFWRGIAAGDSGIGPLGLFASGAKRLAAEIPDFAPQDFLGPKGLRLLDRTTLLALVAADLALKDAGLHDASTEARRGIGVVLASTCGSPASRSAFFLDALESGFRGLNPALFANTVVNSPASQVAIRFGLTGPNATISTGFTGGLDALAYAADLLHAGRVAAVLVGGAEELGELMFHALDCVGLCAPGDTAAGPYDRRRSGAVLGEGAFVMVLETVKLAKKRHAAVMAEYAATAVSAKPRSFGRYERHGRALRAALAEVLRQGATAPDDIAWVATGANGSLVGDAVEARALEAVLGRKPLVAACKGAVGETFSAGAAMQAALAVLALERNEVPPTAHCTELDRRCPVDCWSGASRPAPRGAVLLSADSPMGMGAAGLIRRWEG